MFPKKTSNKPHRGFTLLETIVYVGLFGLVFLAITNAIIAFYQSNRYTLAQTDQIDSARKGIAGLVGGVREAMYSESGAYPLEAAAGNSITFYGDTDNDGLAERIRYFLSDNNFRVGVIKPAGSPAVYDPASETVTTIAQYVRNAEQAANIFSYYDTNGALLSIPPALVVIRYVKVNLIVNVNPAATLNGFTIRSSAAIRNVKSNL